MNAPLSVLSIASLFPNADQPNFGIFVERSLAALAMQPGIELTVVAPIAAPVWPLSLRHPYRALQSLPRQEDWHGLTVLRPRWRIWPGLGAARNGPAMAAAVLNAVRDQGPFDVVDAQFFHPDGVAAQIVAGALSLPYSIKARGTDIQLWALRPDTAPGILAAARGAGGLLSVAESLRGEMAEAGMDAARITIHRTGVDQERFRPLDQQAARQKLGVGDGPVILTVGTLFARKGQHLVIDALPALPDATYLIVGTGPDADRLAAQAAARGVAERVRFLGNVSNAELPSLYNAADVMALPSDKEGLANAWVEAMACGTPIVTADIPPAYEAIDHPGNGRIAARDPGAIAEAVRALLSHPPDRAALSARTHAKFDWAKNGAELAAHLRHVAAVGSGGGIRKIALAP
jgi:glycosyltransferase involved in cell wall biosynthesis